jgi:predicted AlkP superfamily phosphohydrolase/phosphomutase
VGFDGATEELCDRWVSEGRMPNLRALRDDGAHGPLRSTVPYNSAVAWTSLATGTSPARHGIFDFVLPRQREYGYRVATREDRRVPALWNHASRAGARVAVVNIPMTFPAEPVNGVMVSGMDAPRLEERSVHPAGFLEELHRLCPDYRIVSKAALRASRGDFDGSERELIEVVVARSRLVRALAGSGDLDLVMVNLEATDGAHHFFWQHHDPSHPRHDPEGGARWGDAIGRVYEASDRELGRLIDAHAPDTVFVVSDHGGGPSSDWVLFLNDWLAAEGLLAIRPRRAAGVGRRLYGLARNRLSVPMRRALRPVLGAVLERAKSAAMYGDVDWSASVAYAHMEPAIRINVAGREPAGSVPPEGRGAAIHRVAERARALRLPSGDPAFAGVLPTSEVEPGRAPGGPDVLLDISPGLHIRSRNTSSTPGFVRRVADLGIYLPSGVHTRLGMVVAAGAGVSKAGRVEEADILQVAGSILAVMGVPAPELEAAPLPFVSAVPVRTGASLPSTEAPGTELTPDEEQTVLDHLRGLGYVD